MATSITKSFQSFSVQSISSSISFCDNCNECLNLPFLKVEQKTLLKFRNRCAKLHKQESTYLDSTKITSAWTHEIFSDVSKISSLTSELKLEPIGIQPNSDISSFKELRLSTSSELKLPLINQSELPRLEKGIDWLSMYKHYLNETKHKCRILEISSSKPCLRKARITKTLPKLLSRNNVKLQRQAVVEPKNVGLFSRPTILDIQPQKIIFEHLEIGYLSKKPLKITNISTKKCILTVTALKTHSQFAVKSSQPMTSLTLAPGMRLQLVIEFKCSSLANTQEDLIINIQNSSDLVVPIIASSSPPHLIEMINGSFDILDIKSDIHSLIDCGTSLVGDQRKLQLELKNNGSSARFCFVSEKNWHALEFEVDNSNVLKIDCFDIEPMFFSLEKKQSVVLTVLFNPPAEGFHTAQAFLLCSNAAVKKIDFTGDGFLFDPSYTEFLGMVKTFDVDIEDDNAADYYLDFGEMLTSSKKHLFFFLAHNGLVNISYHWEIELSSISSSSPLPPKALNITPAIGRLTAKSVEPFCLSCDTEYLAFGSYRMILCFVVDDLPTKCLSKGAQKTLLTKDYDECSVTEDDFVSVKDKCIEVWVQCVKPNITIFPYVIDFSDSTLLCGSDAEIREVLVENNSPGIIQMEWVCFESSSPQTTILVTPRQFVCKEFSTITCTVSVEPLVEGEFRSVFKLISDKEVCLDLLIRGFNCKPHPEKITKTLDLGLVKLNSEQHCYVVVKNNVDTKTSWYVDELCFTNFKGLKELKHLDIGGKLSAHFGEFCHKDSNVVVKYELNTDADTLFCSVLDWSGSYIPVIANIETTDVSLSSYTVKPEILFLGVQTSVKVFLKNHTDIPTAICWGNIISKNLRCLTVEINPRFAVLRPKETVCIEIHLIPNVEGLLENIYVPCFVELKQQPLLLKIEGHVEGLKVRVEWDTDKKHHCIHWPLLSTENKELRSLDSVICKCPPNSPNRLLTPSLSNDYDDHFNESIICEYSKENEKDLMIQGSNDLKLKLEMFNDVLKETNEGDTTCNVNLMPSSSIKSSAIDEFDIDSKASDEEKNSVQRPSFPYMDWPIVGGKYYRMPMSTEMEKHYWDLFTLEVIKEESNKILTAAGDNESNSLYFNDVPLKQVTTQTIYIRNDTLINSCFEICVLNNFERNQSDKVKCVPEKIQKFLNHKYSVEDLRFSRASKDRGLTIVVEPSSGLLPADDYIVVNVSVLALSWGLYTDYLVIQLDNVEELCIKMCIAVNQPPVKVPHLLKFGSLNSKYNSDLRKIVVENTSTVPIYIIWQLFSPDVEEGSEVADYSVPFGVMIYDADPLRLQMCDYFGSFGSKNFQVSENCTYLMPCSSATVGILFTPLPCSSDVFQHEFKKVCRAVLVGIVYLTEDGQSMSVTEECYRIDGMKLEPLEIHIEGTLEFPVLSLHNVYRDQMEFRCTANDVMTSENKIWKQERIITVKNCNHVDLTAKVSTCGYFAIKNINYPCQGDSKSYSLSNLIVLSPGETCKVTLVCEVTESDLYDTFPEENFPQPDTDVQAEFYGLVTFKQDFVQQDVELKLTIYPPLIDISETSLNFGLVFIRDKKVLIVTITSLLNNETFEASLKNECDGVFSINITSGILVPKKRLILQVKFSPKATGFYRDTLIIKACFDLIHWEIPLTGFGTFDYRAHLYNTSD